MFFEVLKMIKSTLKSSPRNDKIIFFHIYLKLELRKKYGKVIKKLQKG